MKQNKDILLEIALISGGVQYEHVKVQNIDIKKLENFFLEKLYFNKKQIKESNFTKLIYNQFGDLLGVCKNVIDICKIGVEIDKERLVEVLNKYVNLVNKYIEEEKIKLKKIEEIKEENLEEVGLVTIAEFYFKEPTRAEGLKIEGLSKENGKINETLLAINFLIECAYDVDKKTKLFSQGHKEQFLNSKLKNPILDTSIIYYQKFLKASEYMGLEKEY